MHPELRPRLRLRKVHAYAASFGDDFAWELIAQHTNEGEVVLDPFAGAATTLSQARILSRSAIGLDVDPVACLIGRVLTVSYTLDEIDYIYSSVLGRVAALASDLSLMTIGETNWDPGASFLVDGLKCVVPDGSKVEFWFSPVHRAVLGALVALANSFTDARHKDVVDLAVSSSIVRKWPNTISQARDIDHSRPHRVLRKNLSLESQFDIFRKALKGIALSLRTLNAPPKNHLYSTQVIQGDAGQTLAALEPNSVDYVLTSPPYLNAIDYPRAHQFSQWWLWPDRKALPRKHYIGLRPGGKDADTIEHCRELVPARISGLSWIRETSKPTYVALCRYVVDMDSVISGLARVLRPGKPATFVVANNAIRGNEIPVVEIVTDLLERNGFAGIAAHKREINRSRRRYPYGIKGFRGLMSHEHILHATKAD